MCSPTGGEQLPERRGERVGGRDGQKDDEFSVTGDQHVELTATSLDESEACLLTGLRDGTMKMWNYSVGECLLTFPNPDQMEVSLVHQLGPGGPSQLL